MDISRAEEIIAKLQEGGFAHTPDPTADTANIDTFEMDRAAYATMFGPTTGDTVRLGFTDLWIKVEKDLTVRGDECKFGGGKTLREGMGQASGVSDEISLDLVIVNALIVDWTGIYKADIGVKNGVIVGIGKAGNPDVMEGVDPNLIVGSCTDVIAGEGKIITAGGFDTHIHFICPQQIYEAISSGITTMLGGGTGPRYVDFRRHLFIYLHEIVLERVQRLVRLARITCAKCFKHVTLCLSTWELLEKATTATLLLSENKSMPEHVVSSFMKIGEPLLQLSILA